MSHVARRAAATAAASLVLTLLAAPALADHTDPNDPLTLIPADGMPGTGGNARGEGEWEHVVSFPGHQASDITFFRKGGKLFGAQGTLGQGAPSSLYVGQRIVQLLDADGELDVAFRADHGSAACGGLLDAANLGLQHDSFATPPADPELLVDATDSLGRCHDADGGGLELIDISGLDDEEFEPREVHLIRFNATTHTTTLDPQRPWIVYSNNSAFADNNWIDFADIRSCLTQSAGGLLADSADLDTKREQCRPQVYRIPFEDAWTLQTVDGESPPDPDLPPTGCHDTVVENNILYCSGIHADVLLDVSDLVDAAGTPRGEPLPCTVLEPGTFDAEDTGAAVTDCVITEDPEDDDDRTAAQRAKDAYNRLDPRPQATGWSHLGHYNHPGTTQGNTNHIVPADEGVAVSHETRPFPMQATGGRHLILVSDERGGGVVPGGATCLQENFDVFWHSGMHVLDVTDPANIHYATMVDDDGNESRAVWRGEVIHPHAAFCVVHRFRFLEGEQRVVMAYYSQGIKILDFEFDEQGRIRFDEVASLLLPQANTWTADVFHSEDNPDGTRTYFIAASDTLASSTQRGLDVLTWTAEPNPLRDPPAPPGPVIDRVAGPGRIDTAVEVSKRGFDSADTVLLAREDDYADALAGAPLAAHSDAPVLLTYSHRLPDQTAAEIERLGARRVILLGGEAAISPDVADALTQQLVLVERIGGANRFDTARLIAAELPDGSTAFVTEGEHAQADRGWPDALSAAPYAALTAQPVLLVNRDRLPAETAQALADREVTETIVVGGSAAVGAAVFDQLGEAGHGPRRLAGSDRYATSAEVLREALAAGARMGTTWLATGLNWPDALTAGAVAGGEGDALLLVHGRTLENSPATRDALAERIGQVSVVRLLGGTGAISPVVHQQVAALSPQPAPDPPDDGEDEDGGGLPLPPLAALLVLPAAALVGRARRSGIS